MTDYKKIFVNGRWKRPNSEKVVSIPKDDEETTFPDCNAQDVQVAVRAAKDAVGAWSAMDTVEKEAHLKKMSIKSCPLLKRNEM